MERLPSGADFAARRVTNPDQSEIVRQRFYDYALYPTAGATQINFFSLPIGQGLTSALGAAAGTPKTAWDTNLSIASTLPSGKAYMIESIEVVFFPGSVNTANTYTVASPALFNATAAAAVAAQLADVNSFYQSGLLELNILDKNYLSETPLFAFPPKQQFRLDGSVASNSATTAEVGFANMRIEGRPYYLEPTIALQPAVNFNVLLRWPAAVATPSGFNARVGVILDGYFMRASQ
jgi:hypothetical protein